MEFHEKLQQLRKQHNLTQEQLAQRLFVSRTAVSKWESGRGYPNLESLKGLSVLFSVSIDELLSNDELVELAKSEQRTNISNLSGLVFGLLDLIPIALLFMPLFGQPDGTQVRAVTLFACTEISNALRALYFVGSAVLSSFGLVELFLQQSGRTGALRLCKHASIALSSALILLFALSRQPYITVYLFLLFTVKIMLLFQERHIR